MKRFKDIILRQKNIWTVLLMGILWAAASYSSFRLIYALGVGGPIGFLYMLKDLAELLFQLWSPVLLGFFAATNIRNILKLDIFYILFALCFGLILMLSIEYFFPEFVLNSNADLGLHGTPGQLSMKRFEYNLELASYICSYITLGIYFHLFVRWFHAKIKNADKT